MILRADQRQNMFAVRQSKKARLFSVEELLDDNFRARRAEGAVEHEIDRLARILLGIGDDDAFAGREPVRLDDDGKPQSARKGLGARRIAKAAIGSGRNIIFRTKVFHEAFGALEHRAFGAGSQRLDPHIFQLIGETRHQGGFRSDDHEIDLLFLGKGDQGVQVCDRDRSAFGNRVDARIAGRAI